LRAVQTIICVMPNTSRWVNSTRPFRLSSGSYWNGTTLEIRSVFLSSSIAFCAGKGASIWV
jgi:hypothetical protein